MKTEEFLIRSDVVKEKILMIGPLPPPPGGVAMVTQTLVNSDLSDRYSISVLDISRKRRRYKVVSGGGISSLFYLILFLAKLSYRLYKEKPVIIHIQSATAALLRDFFLMILGKLWGKKIVFHLHGFYADRHLAFKYDILKHFSQFMMRRVDILILLANTFVPGFDRLFPHTRKAVVPNSAPQGSLRKPPNMEKRSKPGVDILFVGRLSRLKGIYDLLEAAFLLKEDEDVRFLLAGLGDTREDEERIAGYIERNGLGDKVSLLGYVKGQRKMELFESSDILVLPSYTEMFPVVVVEAMAAAMPVIATSVGAIQEIVEDGICGFVIPPGDHRLLAEKIRYLVRHPEKRMEMEQNSLRKFHREYRVDICVDKIDRIYRSLL